MFYVKFHFLQKISIPFQTKLVAAIYTHDHFTKIICIKIIVNLIVLFYILISYANILNNKTSNNRYAKFVTILLPVLINFVLVFIWIRFIGKKETLSSNHIVFLLLSHGCVYFIFIIIIILSSFHWFHLRKIVKQNKNKCFKTNHTFSKKIHTFFQ